MHLRTPSSLAIWVALFLSLSGLHCGGGGGSSGEEDTATGEEGSQQQDSAEDGEEGEEGDSGTTDQSGSESTGEGEATTPTESEGESNALPPADATSLSSLAVDSSKIAISVPVDGNTTLTGSSASFVVLDDSTANCSAIALAMKRPADAIARLVRRPFASSWFRTFSSSGTLISTAKSLLLNFRIIQRV